MEARGLVTAEFHEPPPLEVLLTKMILGTIGSGWYRRHIGSLGLKEDWRVIDFGSGAGIGAKYAARTLKNGHLTCVDISGVWLDEARKRLKRSGNVDFQLGDICDLPLADGTCDAVIISFVLHDIPDGMRAHKLRCLSDKLKTGGKIFVTEPASGAEGISPEEMRELMAAAGMREEKSSMIRVPMMGTCFDATFAKP